MIGYTWNSGAFVPYFVRVVTQICSDFIFSVKTHDLKIGGWTRGQQSLSVVAREDAMVSYNLYRCLHDVKR